MARHQKKIKFCLLRIAEKEILADVDPEDLVNTVAGIDRECGFVVDAGLGDIQGVEKIVSADLCLKTSGTIFRTACLGDRGWSGSWLSSVVIACVFHECMSFLSKLM